MSKKSLYHKFYPLVVFHDSSDDHTFPDPLDNKPTKMCVQIAEQYARSKLYSIRSENNRLKRGLEFIIKSLTGINDVITEDVIKSAKEALRKKYKKP